MTFPNNLSIPCSVPNIFFILISRWTISLFLHSCFSLSTEDTRLVVKFSLKLPYTNPPLCLTHNCGLDLLAGFPPPLKSHYEIKPLLLASCQIGKYHHHFTYKASEVFTGQITCGAHRLACGTAYLFQSLFSNCEVKISKKIHF